MAIMSYRCYYGCYYVIFFIIYFEAKTIKYVSDHKNNLLLIVYPVVLGPTIFWMFFYDDIYSLLFLDHSISLAIFILELFHSQAIRRWFNIKLDTLYAIKWMVTLLKYKLPIWPKIYNASVHWCVPIQSVTLLH